MWVMPTSNFCLFPNMGEILANSMHFGNFMIIGLLTFLNFVPPANALTCIYNKENSKKAKTSIGLSIVKLSISQMH